MRNSLACRLAGTPGASLHDARGKGNAWDGDDVAFYFEGAGDGFRIRGSTELLHAEAKKHQVKVSCMIGKLEYSLARGRLTHRSADSLHGSSFPMKERCYNGSILQVVWVSFSASRPGIA